MQSSSFDLIYFGNKRRRTFGSAFNEALSYRAVVAHAGSQIKYVRSVAIPAQTQAESQSRKKEQLLFLQQFIVFVPKVQGEVTVGALFELTASAGVGCRGQWNSLARLLRPTPPHTHTYGWFRQRAGFLLPSCLWPASKHPEKNSINTALKITPHTCLPRRIYSTPPSHPPTFPGQSVAQKKQIIASASHPVVAYLLFSSVPILPSPPLPIRLQSQTSAAGQGDVPLNPEEFNVGETTGEKLITFPDVQSALYVPCQSPPPPSASVPSNSERIPCWFPFRGVHSSCEWAAICPHSIICCYAASAGIPMVVSALDFN